MIDNQIKEEFENYKRQSLENISITWSSILEIWGEIGLVRESINVRNGFIAKYFQDVANEIKDGEIDLKNEINTGMINCKIRANQMLSGLDIKLEDLLNSKQNDAFFEEVIKSRQVMLNDLNILNEKAFYRALIDYLGVVQRERLKKFRELKSKENDLCEVLDESSLPVSEETFIKLEQITALEQNIERLIKEKTKRIETIKNIHKQTELIVDVHQIRLDPDSSLKTLVSGINSNNSSTSNRDNSLNDDISIDNSSINRFRLSFDKLMGRRQELIHNIDKLRQEIQSLWSMLNIENSELTEHVKCGSNYTELTHKLLIDEYDKCSKMKQMVIKDLIKSLRDKINNIWDECLFGDYEKAYFIPFYNDRIITDELYEIHVQYLNDMNDYSKKYDNLIKSVKDWQNTWASYLQFDEQYSDPNRFKNRNYSSLFEERERKRFNLELPKLEKIAQDLAQAFTENEKREFTIYGSNLNDYITSQKNVHYEQKENIRRNKQIKKESDLKKEAFYGTSSAKQTSKPFKFSSSQINSKTPKTADKRTLITNKTQTPLSAKHSLAKKSIQFNSDPKPKTNIRPKASLQQYNLPNGSTPSSARVFSVITESVNRINSSNVSKNSDSSQKRDSRGSLKIYKNLLGRRSIGKNNQIQMSNLAAPRIYITNENNVDKEFQIDHSFIDYEEDFEFKERDHISSSGIDSEGGSSLAFDTGPVSSSPRYHKL